MTIDLRTEELLTLHEASASLPTRPHHSVIYRWAADGLRGIRLRHTKIGRRMLTSREALTEFFEALTERDIQERDARRTRAQQTKPVTTRAREASKRRAEAILDKAGI